ncbi:Peptide chain release factor N(5)-glutamine methyltransferase [hydrothermal vent metagenome]|uniref:peptide chain release factor N(5)-glutamine methyltransferase n=1 Tax=hydrothermal vent metagenome TaxID=652676 RepID=A0A3B1B9G5_9ZZZZ
MNRVLNLLVLRRAQDERLFQKYTGIWNSYLDSAFTLSLKHRSCLSLVLLLSMSRTIDDAIHHAIAILAQSQDDNIKLDAELLLASVLDKDRTWLRTWPDKTISPAHWQAFEIYVQRRKAGEPVAYLLGQRDFWSLSLRVTPDTLIPRPETELLVELALAKIPENAPWRILDLGTGSGAIALAIARERPGCELIASDQSLSALQIARQNAQHNALNNIHFLAANWLTAFSPDFHADMILSNPPYIVDDDPHLSAGDVQFEPISALAAGPEGLDDLQHILIHAKIHLKPGGWLLMEHGYHQQTAMAELLKHHHYQSILCHKDYAGQPRVSLAQRADN